MIEKDVSINESVGTKRITIDLPFKTWYLAKTNLLEFKEVMLFGIQFTLAEKGVLEYPKTKRIVNLENNINKLQEVLKELGDEKIKLELQIEDLKK